ncbi:primase-like DNA-binding domain-containing protein [Xenorhabdus bovienii]|uniref:primase-like DNA-binding domain-containing protein n=1 Tax=Xenorhabdus bovienii TaxID=40576 RepID=UPI00237D29E7|nr:primase-like DNA-binding domain-containing protein [Xenorhabdus bovienii]MDE1476416.1 toprim domain-containing protein [Xenorhabdus bovienii]
MKKTSSHGYNSRKNNEVIFPIDFIHTVKKSAINHWQSLLPACGVDVPAKGKHGACPICGGTDRFHFIDDNNNGDWHCRQCDQPNHGDGLDLVARTKGSTIFEAAKLVSGALALPLPEPKLAKEKPRTVKTIMERVAALVATSVIGESQYLLKKGLQFPNQRLLKDGSLLLVMQALDGTVTGAQTIKPNGEKRLVSGSQKKGSFLPLSAINGTPDTIIIAEGYATALTVSQLHEGVVLAAIDEGNLFAVAGHVRERWPDAKIILAADNDMKSGHKNVGKISAEKAAKSVRGWVTWPPTEEKADWDDYRQQHGIEAAKQAFSQGLYQVGKKSMGTTNVIEINSGKQKKKPKIDTETDIAKLAPNQLATLLISRYGQLAVHPESLTIYHYNGATWQSMKDSELSREMANFFIENETHFSMRRISGVVDVLKVIAEPMGETGIDLIGFSNGVLNTKTHAFRPHNPDDWLLHQNGITYTEPEEDENLKEHAPNYLKWLNHVSGGNPEKARRIKAGLYMVFGNRHDWQMFIEATGAGGSGKSVFAHVAELLAGKHNASSGELKDLDDARGRAQFVGKKLILLPDQNKYSGDGAGLKAITGGDSVGINPKYEKQFSIMMKCVVLITGNKPMQFTERNNGIARRRVIFHFNDIVEEKNKDKSLPEKIEAEIPVIIRDLLREFPQPEIANALLIEQRGSGEATEIKRETDPLIDFCAYLIALEGASGMLMGNANITPPAPRKYLYHAYMSYMQGNGNKNSLSLTTFGRSIDSALKELGKRYIRERTMHGYRTNLELNETEAEDWLPRVPTRS